MKSNEFFIGISLALLSYLFIGSSFVLKKKALLKLTNVRAGFGYLYELQWWIGLIAMGIGEICNFVAYGFTPASVLFLFIHTSALMAVRFLDEKLNVLSKIGCLLTVCGSVIIVIHAPKENILKMHNYLLLFIFNFRISFLFIYNMYWNIMFNILLCSTFRFTICSLLGAFTITACKGIAIGLKELYTHK
ncbi:unnamed protein product [Adineta steineri]|uniref:Magnesium transporter n=1 Tax=Adineta steineri TaxID=433720 RepID=A0A818N4T6_9BILA|nr:unnamed protein product [Adineta steineri]CAF3600844.1 unnamed protein product [Adineta steineri]